MKNPRKLMFLAVLLVLSLLLVACTGAPAEDGAENSAAENAAADNAGAVAGGDTELNIYNWSTYMDPAIIERFEQQFGVKVTYDEYADNEEMLAKIQPGNPGYDIGVPTDYMVETMVNLELLIPLDHSKVPNLGNVDATFANPPYDPGMEHCAPYQWGTLGLGYNIAETGRELDSWDVMFNHEFADRISWLSEARMTLGATLLYLGYDLNTTNPDEIDEARQLLEDTKDDVVAFAGDNGQELLNNGEVDIAFEYSGDIAQLMAANPDIRYTYPKEGTIVWTDNMCIPVGAPHPELAHAFINFILDPEIGGMLSNYIQYGTPNAAAQPYLDEAVVNNPAIYPPEDVKGRLHFIQTLGDADLLYEDAWTELGVSEEPIM